MKVYIVRDTEETIYDDPLCVKEHIIVEALNELVEGEEITITTKEMSEKEYYSLPEA